jgi:hypothetical protein
MFGASGATAPEASFRCLLLPNAVGLQAPNPTLALDVSKDTVRLVDPSNNAPVAEAWRSQITATPAMHRPPNYGAGIPMPVLVVHAPGWQPLVIGSPEAGSWRGEVPEEAPGYVVSDADWPVLVDIFSLGPQLASRRSRGSGRRLVRGRERLGVGGWLSKILFASLGVLFLCIGVGMMHTYQVGTPTKVTVTHCSSGKGASCEGKWTIDGVSQSGSIEHGFFSTPAPGSLLDAHVWGRTAYTSTAAYLPFGVGGAFTVGVVVSLVRRRRFGSVVLVFAVPVIALVAFLVFHPHKAQKQSTPSTSWSGTTPTADPAIPFTVGPGGNLTAEPTGETLTFACDQGDLVIGGNNNSVHVVGHCAHLSVHGSHNKVIVDSADAIDTDGSGNQLIYLTGEPRISIKGSENTVNRG